MDDRVTEKVPGKDFFMTVYRIGGGGGYYSATGQIETARPLLELEPDEAQRRVCDQHFHELHVRVYGSPL